MGRLENKIAIITGGNSGIGEATAKMFAREGATVMLTARREGELKRVADEIIAAGGTAVYVPGDVKNTADVQRVVDETIRQFGRIDILVNNAGIGDGHKSTINMTDEFWDEILDVDLKGVMRFCRAVLPHMVEAGRGSVVNISSIGGTYYCAGAAYSSAKSGVIAITKNLAIQYYGTGIRFNCVSPGGTDTPLFSPENFKDVDTEMMEATFKKRSRDFPPEQRHLQPDDQAYAILFLASDEARGINGENLVVNRGGNL